MARRNQKKAIATGATVGAGSSVLVTWLAAMAASKWSMPIEAAAAIVSPMFGFITALAMRWAAKLEPRD